ncbi:MAG TPA: MBL fold metallo-hydrolase [Candidatus Bilamarchaeaceae archaeon]|nr:MBL fold metallo-hydrolase [Candidatus Bilamarchaeaceae archaeon]
MKKIFAVLIVAFFLFGCIDLGGTPPVDNKTNGGDTPDTPPDDGDDGVVIIKTTNQTSIVNRTREDNKTDTRGYNYDPSQKMAMYFIYVGDDQLHGDAILIKKGDFDMLVDGGPKENSNRVINFLKSHSVDNLEVMVSTHADPEHYGGLIEVAREFEIEEFWYTGSTFEDETYADFVNSLDGKGVDVTVVERGDSFSFNGVTFDILNPKSVRFGNPDNDAIVMKVTNGLDRILLTSDINSGAQGNLLNEADMSTDVLMIPFHGLGNGNFQFSIFLTSINPVDAVISGGTNDGPDYGGDRKPLFRILDLNHVPYKSNFDGGIIRIISDGQSYKITQIE